MPRTSGAKIPIFRKNGIAPAHEFRYHGTVAQLSVIWFFALITVQGLILGVDEFFFHWKRDLPPWERWGHPVDTFLFLAPLLVLWWSPEETGLFAGLAVLSSLVITKDEFHHSRWAGGAEQWLHSLLFLLHPAVLGAAYWTQAFLHPAYGAVLLGIGAFGIYQIMYWNWLRRTPVTSGPLPPGPT